ncbi:MMPL family transporter [Rhodovibrio salinarum]|uniref:MMPL family transporter n=1 Tax=Rhodovibrio salinarum TaxID=1087 RepID=UPI000480D349|nr:MMPL family transporter [Rhodovibrio salinarum]
MRARLTALLRPLLVLALLGALGAGLLSQVPIRADLSILLPERQSEDLALLQRALQEGPANRTVMIALRPVDPPADAKARTDQLAELSRTMKRALQDSGLFARVANGSLSLDDAALQPFLEHRYRLNPALAADAFSPSSLNQAFDRLLVELRGLGSPLIERIMPRDPTLRIFEVAQLWRGDAGPRKANGVWVGRDGTRAVLLARSKRAAFDAGGQGEVLDAIDAAVRTVEQTHGAITAVRSGPSVIAVESRNTAESESRRLLIWSLPIVALILLIAFRRPSVLVASAVPIAAGFVAGAGAVAAVFGEILAPTLGFGAILIGVGVDYPLHLFAHRRPEEPPTHTARRIWPALALGAATTAIGFLPLVLSSFPGVAQLGVFTLAGLLVAAGGARWILPWLMQPVHLPPAEAVWDRLAPLHAALGRLRLPTLLLTAVAAGWLALLPGSQVWQQDLRGLSPISETRKQVDQSLRADLAATNPRYLLAIDAPDMETLLQRQEALQPTLDKLIADGAVAQVDLLARYLPSAARQRARLASLPDAATLRQRLDRALADQPFSPGTFAPFVTDVAAAKAAGPLTPSEIAAPLLRSRLDTLAVETTHGQVRGFGFFEGLRDEARLRHALAHVDVPGVRLLDLKAETEALMQGYRDETLRWIAVGALLGLGALAIGLRGARAVGQVGASVLVSVTLSAALLVALGTPLTLFHLLGLMVVAGLGLDYAIFLRQAVRDGANSPEAGRDGRRSVAICALTSLSVFAILSTAEIPMLGQLGVTVALGAGVSLLSALVFTGALRTHVTVS